MSGPSETWQERRSRFTSRLNPVTKCSDFELLSERLSPDSIQSSNPLEQSFQVSTSISASFHGVLLQ